MRLLDEDEKLGMRKAAPLLITAHVEGRRVASATMRGSAPSFISNTRKAA
jgi:hypothetical protein